MKKLRSTMLVGCTLSTLLAACGSNDAPGDTAAPVAAVTTPNPNAEFTAAVAAGNNAAPARVHFRLGARPAVGEPLVVAVRIVPTSDIDRLQVFFEADSGIGFIDEAQSTFAVDALKTGNAHSHELQVLPGQEGVFLLKVNVTADMSGVSKSSEFAIPLLVGSPPPAPPAGG